MDYNLVCVNCNHGPHANGQCKDCPCERWLRPDVACSLVLLQLNKLFSENIPKFLSISVDLLELMVEAFPEAAAAVDAKREAWRRENEAPSQQSRLEPDPQREDADSGSGNGQTDIQRTEGASE